MARAKRSPTRRSHRRGNSWPAMVPAVLLATLATAVAAAGIVVHEKRADAAAAEVDRAALHTRANRASPTPTPSPVAGVQQTVTGTTLRPLTKKELRARAAAAARRLARKPMSFTLGTMNVLGSQHTGPHGDQHRGWPSASYRTPRQAAAIGYHHADVVGLQEAQPDQLNGLLADTGYKAFPGYQFGAQDTDNSILYDPKKFKFVSGTSFRITFMHAVRPQTVLRLKYIPTGREMYFINCHTSAGHEGRYTASRYAGMATLVSYVRSLKAKGLPIFVTGDMNDREEFVRRVLGPAGLTAAINGSWKQRTFGRGWLAVDWIASTQGVSWTNYWVETFQSRHISDHYFITATANLPGVR